MRLGVWIRCVKSNAVRIQERAITHVSVLHLHVVCWWMCISCDEWRWIILQSLRRTKRTVGHFVPHSLCFVDAFTLKLPLPVERSAVSAIKVRSDY